VFWTSATEGVCFGNHYGRKVVVEDNKVYVKEKLSPSDRLKVMTQKRFQEKQNLVKVYGVWTPLLKS